MSMNSKIQLKLGKKSLVKLSLVLIVISSLILLSFHLIPIGTGSGDRNIEIVEYTPSILGNLWSKKVLVHHKDPTHYYNVPVKASIPENLVDIKMYRYLTESMMNKVSDDPDYSFQVFDLDGDGKNDTVSWIIPELSEVSFSVEGTLTEIQTEKQIIQTQTGEPSKLFGTLSIPDTYDCAAENITCTLTTVTEIFPDGSSMTMNYQKPVNFYNETSGQYERINRTIYQCVVPGHQHWTWCRNGYYTTYFRNDTTTNETEAADWLVAFQVDDETWVKSKPQSIFFWNRTKQKRISQLLNETYAQFQTNNTQIYYKNAFGTGYTISYTYDNDRLMKKFRIRRLSDINQTLADQLDGTRYFLIKEKFKFSPNLVAYIEDQGWDNVSDKETNKSVVFKKDGIPLLYFPPPVAEDASGNTTNGTYYLSYSAPFLQIAVYYPYDWLLNATFPVIMDPTVAKYYEKEIDYYSINNTLNDYYFNASNAEQRTNDIQNYWSVNDFCLNLYFDSAWHEFCGDSLDWVWYNSTDFTTYTNLTGNTSIEYGSYSTDISLEYYLVSDSSDIRITPRIKNTGNNISNLELKIHIHDIKINNTYENDTFRVTLNVSEDEDLFQNYDLSNTSLNLSFDQTNLTNRSSYLLDFPDSNLINYPDKFGRFIWNKSKWVNEIQSDMDYRLEVEHDSEYNVPVDLILELGSLNESDAVTTNLYWIDDASIRYNKTLSRLYENPWKIDQFFDSNLSRSVEADFDIDVYTTSENYICCINFSDYEKTVNMIYYGWLRKIDEPTGIKGHFSGTRKINKSSDRECWYGEMNVSSDSSTIWKIAEIIPGKYMFEAYYYVYEPNEHYLIESEMFEIT